MGRIPPKTRKEMISRYYMVQLKKHVRNQKAFISTVKTAVSNEKELVQFLKMFGADDSQIQDTQPQILPQSDVSSLPFYHFNEDTALQLIAISAQFLAREDPWQDHPANKDVETSGGRRGARGSAMHTSSGSGNPAQNVARMLAADKSVSLGRLCRRPEKDRRRSGQEASSEDVAEAESAEVRVDVDELFRRFTPRLKEICEEQAANRTDAGEAAESPADTVTK